MVFSPPSGFLNENLNGAHLNMTSITEGNFPTLCHSLAKPGSAVPWSRRLCKHGDSMKHCFQYGINKSRHWGKRLREESLSAALWTPQFPRLSLHTLSVTLLVLQPFHLASLNAVRIPQPEAAKWHSVSKIHEVSPGLVLICVAFLKKKKKVSYDSELMFWSCNIPFTNLDSRLLWEIILVWSRPGTQLSGSPHWSKDLSGARVSLELPTLSVFPITLLPF